VNETAWQSRVIDYALLRGWHVHHARPARTAKGWRTAIIGHPGFPDLILARGCELLAVELKTDKGRATEAQLGWLDALNDAGAYAVVWRPADWDRVQEVLR
jgi:VRR-NUC domain